MNEVATIGWDVGGAHLKAALVDASGRLLRVTERPCALWQGLDRLQAALGPILAELPGSAVVHGVTMSGEMTDLFPDRAAGVAAIARHMGDALARRRRDMLRVYAGEAGFVAADEASRHAAEIASANWIASAAWCARECRDGLLVDIGSTTTDLIPWAGGRLVARGRSAAGRLQHGELVYVGIVRTPLMALASRAPVGGAWRATMNELFATSADVFRLLGDLDEATDLHPAADGGAKTRDGSARRLLRMVGEDLGGLAPAAIHELARWYRECLLERIDEGLEAVLARPELPADAPLVGVGIGRFLVPEIAARCGRTWRDGGELLCPADADAALRTWAAHCAPAVAVARLAAAA